MKKLIIIPIVMLIVSCSNNSPKDIKLTEDQKTHIKVKILLQNSSFGLRFHNDSLDDALYLVELKRHHTKADKETDSLTRLKYSSFNNPYMPQNDPRLTYEKFMSYCKEGNYDPNKIAEHLREK